jgi:ligand-binding sensor domain-containing protein
MMCVVGLTRIGRGLALLALLAATAWAQRSLWKSYGRPEGLRELNVNCMHQDHEGFLWVGTENGLYRYDGKRFQQFTKSDGLADAYISALASDADGNLWIGTARGISVKEGGRFAQRKGGPFASGIRRNASLTAWNSGVLLVSSQTLWYAQYTPTAEVGKSGLITPRQFTPEQLQPGHVTSIFKDRQGSLWAGCDGSICQFLGNRWRRWPLPTGVKTDSWSNFLESADGGLWARGQQHAIYLPGNGRRFEDRTANLAAKLFRNPGKGLMEDPSGRVLISTTDGVSWWNGRKWLDFDKVEAKWRSRILPLLVDNQANLWLGVSGYGLRQSRGYDEWDSWTEEDGILGGVVFGITRDRIGRVWFGNHERLTDESPPVQEIPAHGSRARHDCCTPSRDRGQRRRHLGSWHVSKGGAGGPQDIAGGIYQSLEFGALH